MSKIVLKEAQNYFKERVGFDADVNIKMDTVAVTKLMHDFALYLEQLRNEYKKSKKIKSL